MRSPTLRTAGTLGINLTPMIDVVFLLIIFFLFSSHLAQRETSLPMELPTASSTDPTRVEPPHQVLVNLMPEGQILLAGEAVDTEEFVRRLAQDRQRRATAIEVRIRADRHTPYGAVEPLLAACARAGVWQVTFAVVPTARADG